MMDDPNYKGAERRMESVTIKDVLDAVNALRKEFREEINSVVGKQDEVSTKLNNLCNTFARHEGETSARLKNDEERITRAHSLIREQGQDIAELKGSLKSHETSHIVKKEAGQATGNWVRWVFPTLCGIGTLAIALWRLGA